MIENEKPISAELLDAGRPAAIGEAGQISTVEQASANVVAAIGSADAGDRPAGKRGRHKKDCACAKCAERKSTSESNTFDTNFPTEKADVSQVAPTPVPVFDPETVKPIVEGMCQIYDDFGKGLIGAMCAQKGKSPVLCDAASERAAMKPATKAMIVAGGLGCARKWQHKFEYIEETAFIGGMLLHGVCLLMLANTIKNEKPAS